MRLFQLNPWLKTNHLWNELKEEKKKPLLLEVIQELLVKREDLQVLRPQIRELHLVRKRNKGLLGDLYISNSFFKS